MSELKAGTSTSEFRLAGLVAAVTALGDQLNLFDISAFEGDPQLNLIYRCVQVLVLGGIAIAYIYGRSHVKTNGKAT